MEPPRRFRRGAPETSTAAQHTREGWPPRRPSSSHHATCLPPIAKLHQDYMQGFDDEESLILLEQYPAGLLQKLQTSSHAAIEVCVLLL